MKKTNLTDGKTEMNDEREVSFNGNVATVTNIGYNQLLMFVGMNKVDVFACSLDEKNNSWAISFPMTEAHREMYAPLIHRHNNEQKKLAKKNSKDDSDGPPKNTPPSGGGPAAGKVLEFKSTEAISETNGIAA